MNFNEAVAVLRGIHEEVAASGPSVSFTIHLADGLSHLVYRERGPNAIVWEWTGGDFVELMENYTKYPEGMDDEEEED